MNNKYTRDELNQVLNSLEVSHETKRFLEKNLKQKYQNIAWAYINLTIGIIALCTYIFMSNWMESLTSPERSGLIVFATFMIGNGTFSIRTIKTQNALLDIVMTKK